MREGIPVRYRKSQWLSIFLLSLVIGILLTAGLQLFQSCRKSDLKEESQDKSVPELSIERQEQIVPPVTTPQQESQLSPPSPVKEKVEIVSPEVQLTVGQVEILSQAGNLIAEIPAAIVGRKWVALPASSCIGGSKWMFQSGNNEPVQVTGGLWTRGATVGLWFLAGDEAEGPGLSTWRKNEPVRLYSYRTGKFSDEISLTLERTEGDFVFCPLAESMEAGVLMQNDDVVGWTFGSMLQGAWMLAAPLTDADKTVITVEDFYDETFAGSREDFFSRALASRNDATPVAQLQMFMEGFWYPSNLSAAMTPEYLRPATVYPYIEQLIDFLMNQGAYDEIALLADEQLVRELKSEVVLRDVVMAMQKIYGPETAINYLEGQGADIQQTIEGETPLLDTLHIELYSEWINALLANRDFVRGWQIFNRAKNRFQDSPEVHLLGVELALEEGDWAEAETLLYQKKYPDALQEKITQLSNAISRMKGRENQIVINFEPGAKEIPVSATVNAVLEQDFLIDTGSSYVTIPYSAIESLGLEDQLTDQTQEVQTAGGSVFANSITLPSIELQGWVVNNVRALVMDLPNRPGLGLLGLNFLDKFRMDLQSDEGVLILEPQ